MDDFTVVLIVVISVPFLLFIIRIIILCWHNFELSRQIKMLEQQQAALQQVQSAHISTTGDNNSNSNDTINTGSKEFDLPPTYEDAVQSYMLNKQQQQQSGENEPVRNAIDITTNPSPNTLSAAISTLTVETDISNSNNSIAVNVNNHSIV